MSHPGRGPSSVGDSTDASSLIVERAVAVSTDKETSSVEEGGSKEGAAKPYSTVYGGMGATPHVPAPGITPSSGALDVGTGESSTSFEDLGPVVLNEDGSLSRIKNWADMTEAERRRTGKVIAKRNAKRRDVLLKALGKDPLLAATSSAHPA